MKVYGLIGLTLGHSFSKTYFEEKFKKQNIKKSVYQNFEINRIELLEDVLKTPNLVGLNVTIPFKEVVLPFLDEVSDEAKMIGAVNTIALKNNKTLGYNTDFLGFEYTLHSFLKGKVSRAIILGTGGAAKAVAFALKRLGINYQFVSRRKVEGCITYDELISEFILPNLLIINCTPIGTFPKVDEMPPIPKSFLKSSHFVYDLVYNPAETALIKFAKQKGCNTLNGYTMLQLQAEASWEIWNS